MFSLRHQLSQVITADTTYTVRIPSRTNSLQKSFIEGICGQKVLNHNAYSCMLIEDGMLVNKRLPVNTADRWNKATVTYANISELNSSIFKSLLEDPFIVITT